MGGLACYPAAVRASQISAADTSVQQIDIAPLARRLTSDAEKPRLVPPVAAPADTETGKAVDKLSTRDRQRELDQRSASATMNVAPAGVTPAAHLAAAAHHCLRLHVPALKSTGLAYLKKENKKTED